MINFGREGGFEQQGSHKYIIRDRRPLPSRALSSMTTRATGQQLLFTAKRKTELRLTPILKCNTCQRRFSILPTGQACKVCKLVIAPQKNEEPRKAASSQLETTFTHWAGVSVIEGSILPGVYQVCWLVFSRSPMSGHVSYLFSVFCVGCGDEIFLDATLLLHYFFWPHEKLRINHIDMIPT